MVRALIASLVETPVRRDGLLDQPLHVFAREVGSPDLLQWLRPFARGRPKSTLRTVLTDARFLAWVDGVSPRIRGRLKTELVAVREMVDIEAELEDEEPKAGPALVDELPPKPTSPPPDPSPSLLERVQALGLEARLRDPATVLLPRVGPVRQPLTLGGRVIDVLNASLGVSLSANERALLAMVARSYLEEWLEHAVAAQKEDERLSKLFPPHSETAQAFLAAVERAMERSARSDARVVVLETSVVANAVQAAVQVTDDWGRTKGSQWRLPLDGWRHARLERRVSSHYAKQAIIVLRAARAIVLDPEHRSHAVLLDLLGEMPWQRVARRLEPLARAATHPLRPVEWRVAVEQGRLVPFQQGREVSVDRVASDGAETDQLVARILMGRTWSRAPLFQALSLLGRRRALHGARGEPLQVQEGSLLPSLHDQGAGWVVTFEVAGEPLSPADVRGALDEEGFLIAMEPSKDRVRLAHVTQRHAAVIAALATDDAVFPAELPTEVSDRLLELHEAGLVALPAVFAGEAVVADARPHLRLTREGDSSVSLLWFVRPLPDAQLVAGDGAMQLLGRTADGKRVCTTRDFAAELENMEALEQVLPTPSQSTHVMTTYVGLENVLAVADALRGALQRDELVVEGATALLRRVASRDWKLLLDLRSERGWFDVKGRLQGGDVTITLEDLLSAQRARERFIRVGADELLELTEDVRARLAALEAVVRPAENGFQIASVHLPELRAVSDELSGDSAFDTLLARIDRAGRSEPEVPPSFASVLRPYQVEGYQWMQRLTSWGAGALLADDMGLGKTLQALAFLEAHASEGPAIVVAPVSVGPNWIAEARRFAPALRATLHRGPSRATVFDQLGPCDVLVTSYDVLTRDEEALSQVTFATVIVDEAQAIKNDATARAHAVKALRGTARIGLTGTPVENRLTDLHSLMDFLNPNLLPPEDEFRRRFVLPIERDRDPFASGALARLVRPFVLRRRKSEVLADLPPRIEVVRAVERNAREARLYEAAREAALVALSSDDEKARFQVLAEITRLRRLACHPKLFDDTSSVPSSKLTAFLELVRDLREGGHRALVFSQFTGHLALVAEALEAAAVRFLYLDGQTPLEERTRVVAAFQSGEADLFLISLKAGGTGLNLTGADTVLHLDPWWNPAVEDQATDRAHRIGQSKPVTVIRLIAQGTIEEAVVALHDEKRELAEAVLEGSGITGKLSVAELGALIRAGAS